jgi:hypothetical protein
MNFTELLAEVYTITNRPDLVAESTSALRAATLKAHTSDFFSRDLYETEIVFQEKAYIQSVDLYSLFCNYRALKYLRYYDAASGGTPESGTFMEIITPDQVLDSYSYNRADVGYMAGRMLELRACVDFQNAIIGCYILPIISPVSNYSSWVAEIQPWAIINEAARVIFKMIGYDEQSAQYNSLVAEEYQLLKITGITDQGY